MFVRPHGQDPVALISWAAGSKLGVSFPPGRWRAKTLMLALEASASSHRDRLSDFLRS
jgi:hypothetical protein